MKTSHFMGPPHHVSKLSLIMILLSFLEPCFPDCSSFPSPGILSVGGEWMGCHYTFEHFRESCLLFVKHIHVHYLLPWSRFCQSVFTDDDDEGHDEGSCCL